MKLALLYEHPQWSVELLAAFTKRGVAVSTVDVAEFRLAPTTIDAHDCDLWVNRVNVMPSAGRPPSVVAATTHLLLSLESAGCRVFNGSKTHLLGGSKAAQGALFASVGLASPESVAIADPIDAPTAAEQLGFPVIIKPNIGGSGQGIVRYDDAESLEAASLAGDFDLGIDGTGLVQRIVQSADGFVHRIEILGSELLYATRQPILDGAFNYCAADGISASGEGGSSTEIVTPRPELVDAARNVLQAAEGDIGAVEYLIDRGSGQPYFYDFNPYSNLVSGRDVEIGFNPIDRYIDAVVAKARRSRAAE